MATIPGEEASRPEEIAYVPMEEMRSIDGFDEGDRQRAARSRRDRLLTKAIASERNWPIAQLPPKTCCPWTAWISLAHELAVRGVVNREDLAEQSIDDLLDIDADEEAMLAN